MVYKLKTSLEVYCNSIIWKHRDRWCN